MVHNVIAQETAISAPLQVSRQIRPISQERRARVSLRAWLSLSSPNRPRPGEKGGVGEYGNIPAAEIRGRQEGAAQQLRNAVLVRAEGAGRGDIRANKGGRYIGIN